MGDTYMGRGLGKVVLLGEHSVVYGYPALAGALSQGAEAEAEQAAENLLEVQPWGVRVGAPRRQTDQGQSPGVQQLQRAFEAVLADADLAADGRTHTGVHIRARVDVPGGAGLGGSAALAVAVVRALDALAGRKRGATQVAQATTTWERVFHGNPSGVDSTLAAHGGICWYQKGSEPVRISRSPHPLWIVVGHSGRPCSTRTMVDAVRCHYERSRAETTGIFRDISGLAEAGRSALAYNALHELGSLMNSNHGLLRRLRVSTAELDSMCDTARREGALGAKLTGGGGGGCMMALVADSTQGDQVREALAREGYEAWKAEVGA